MRVKSVAARPRVRVTNPLVNHRRLQLVNWTRSPPLCRPSHLQTNSYGHRTMNTRLPVRSALVKHGIARLVLQWVTMRESLVP